MYSQNTSFQENDAIQKIEAELLKAKISYESKDSLLFEDFEDIMASLKVSSFYTNEDKQFCYESIFQFIKDVNQNIHAAKKIEDRDYRRALRFLPSVFYYQKKKKLPFFLQSYPLDANRVITYIQSDEGTQKYMIELGLESPASFYSQIDDFSQMNDFGMIHQSLITYDPATWAQQVEKNPFLIDHIKNTSNPLIKKVLDIKSRFGNNTSLFCYLDHIIKENFDDTKEWEFQENKIMLTKKLLASVQNENAYARESAANYLAKYGKWLFEDFLDEGAAVFMPFTNNEIFTLLALNHQHLEYEDMQSILKYTSKNEDELITKNTLTTIPKTRMYTFFKKLEKADLLNTLKSNMEIDAMTFLVDYLTDIDYKPSLQHIDWFSRPYSYEKEKKQAHISKPAAIPASFHLNKTQLALLNWARNINKVDSNIIGIIKSPIGTKFVEYLANYHPQILLNNRAKLKQLPEFGNIVNRIAYFSPNSIKKYLGNSENEVTKQMNVSADPIAKTILSIYNTYKFNTKAYTLIHKIQTKEMTIEEAHRMSQTEVPYLKKLMSITIQNQPIGIHSVEEEQNQISLKFIREINDHPSVNHPNLYEIRNFTTKEVYSMMVLGKEEIFQFAFDNLYSTFNQNLQESSFLEFLPKVNYYKYREFSTLMATFNKFPELLYKNTSPEARKTFLENMTHINFSDIKCIEQAAVLCEFINNCDHPEIQAIIQNKIQAEYHDAEAKKDQMAMAVYSLLASNIGERAINHIEWFKSMKSKYSKYTLSYIDVNELKNKQNRIIEACYFYNDADGIASYNNFVNTYKSNPNWYTQDLGSYFYISSLSGIDFDILANKPQYEQLGQQSIRDYLVYNKLEPSIVVHRGHSYHSQKTIDQLIGNPKFIFMGSCGGYYKISELLVRSPNAQILSTKQVGTMGINDPMLKTIHDQIRNGQNIDWPTFWTQQELKFKGYKDFKMYVPPHKNNGALFINAFFKVVGL